MPHSLLRKRQRHLHKTQSRNKLFRDQGIRQKGTPALQDRPLSTFTLKRKQLKVPKARPHFLRSLAKLRGNNLIPICTRESWGRFYQTNSIYMMMNQCHQSAVVIRWSQWWTDSPLASNSQLSKLSRIFMGNKLACLIISDGLVRTMECSKVITILELNNKGWACSRRFSPLSSRTCLSFLTTSSCKILLSIRKAQSLAWPPLSTRAQTMYTWTLYITMIPWRMRWLDRESKASQRYRFKLYLCKRKKGTLSSTRPKTRTTPTWRSCQRSFKKRWSNKLYRLFHPKDRRWIGFILSRRSKLNLPRRTLPNKSSAKVLFMPLLHEAISLRCNEVWLPLELSWRLTTQLVLCKSRLKCMNRLWKQAS
jgi:hypothetical protein